MTCFFVLQARRRAGRVVNLKLSKIAYCPWAIRENPASVAANQIARFIKTNACHIIIHFTAYYLALTQLFVLWRPLLSWAFACIPTFGGPEIVKNV
jgi:hypothetical protein